MPCKVCRESLGACHHVNHNTIDSFDGSREFQPVFNKDATISDLRKTLALTQISLGNMNAQAKTNRKEYSLKVTYLMNLNKKLEEENNRLQRKIIQLTTKD